MSIQIEFLGAANTVTGSKYLITHGKKRVLVDCGLFQGLKNLREKNWDGFSIQARDIDAVLLTHAHIDHSGYIPKLIKNGFKGKVFCTEATFDLCKILLPDSGHLMEEEAEYLNKIKRTKHKPALPLFTYKEAEIALDYFQTAQFNKIYSLHDGFTYQFLYAGHILGASALILNIDGVRIAFTGDIGRPEDEIFYPPEVLPEVDYLITESTYGNKLHKKVNILDELEAVIRETAERKGVILISAFAVGRAQALLYYLYRLKTAGRLPHMPMYLNSPMATNVNQLLKKYHKLHRLSPQVCDDVCNTVEYVRSAEDSKALNEKSGPMLIISASGMMSGGRILHHLKSFAPYTQNTILLSGFQSAGTRGEALLNGAAEVKVHGEYVPVRAEVRWLDNLSAHADFAEMITIFKAAKISPRKVFVTHGEPSAADEFRRRLTETFGWTAVVPQMGESFELT